MRRDVAVAGPRRARGAADPPEVIKYAGTVSSTDMSSWSRIPLATAFGESSSCPSPIAWCEPVAAAYLPSTIDEYPWIDAAPSMSLRSGEPSMGSWRASISFGS